MNTVFIIILLLVLHHIIIITFNHNTLGEYSFHYYFITCFTSYYHYYYLQSQHFRWIQFSLLSYYLFYIILLLLPSIIIFWVNTVFIIISWQVLHHLIITFYPHILGEYIFMNILSQVLFHLFIHQPSMHSSSFSFPISVSWVSPNDRSPGLFSVFWLTSTILLFGWSWLILRFLTPPGP